MSNKYVMYQHEKYCNGHQFISKVLDWSGTVLAGMCFALQVFFLTANSHTAHLCVCFKIEF